MKNLKNQGLVHDQNYAEFPNGAIQNEEGNQEGTPVVRQVYNDLLMNFYALLRDRKINFNNLEDNESNGYQILNALKLVFNDYSDSFKILSKDVGFWSLPIDFQKIPSGLVMSVQITDTEEQGKVSLIKGIDGIQYSFTFGTAAKSGDHCVLIINGNDSKIFSLNPKSILDVQRDEFSVFGQPLTQLTTQKKLWYFLDGKLYSMYPEAYDLEFQIQNQAADGTLELRDVIQYKNKFICLVYKPSNFSYALGYFTEGTFDLYHPLSVVGPAFGTGATEDVDVYMFANEEKIYLSNQAGNSVQSNILSRYDFDSENGVLNYVSEHTINDSFVKNTNSVIIDNALVFLRSGVFYRFNFGGSYLADDSFNFFVGQIFRVGSGIFYTNGSVATKFTIL